MFRFLTRRTKQAHFVPCKETLDAAELSHHYIKNIFKLHGIPDEIISDRGPQFRSKFWQALASSLGIKLCMSSAYHPQADGQTERVNQVLEQYLRCYDSYQQDNWRNLSVRNRNISQTIGLTLKLFETYGNILEH